MVERVIRPFKYRVIKGFLDKTEIKLLTDYTRIKHRLNREMFDLEQSNNYATIFYKDPLTETIMLQKKEIMEIETGYKLFPTYSFFRMYTFGSDLKPHTDRSSCEISVTVSIGSDGTPWPIYMDGKEVMLEHGDAAIYFGCEVPHWRKPFEGDWYAQTFLHYVNKDGPHKEWLKDKKILWGQPIWED